MTLKAGRVPERQEGYLKDRSPHHLFQPHRETAFTPEGTEVRTGAEVRGLILKMGIKRKITLS